MKKTISTEALPLFIMICLFWTIFAGSLSVWALISNRQILLSICLFGSIFVGSIHAWLIYRSLLKVSITDEGLELRCLNKSCCVDFDNIKSVSGGTIGHFKLPFERIVRVEFYKPNTFGQSIKFMPELNIDLWEYLKGYQSNSVSMLKDRINKSKETA